MSLIAEQNRNHADNDSYDYDYKHHPHRSVPRISRQTCSGGLWRGGRRLGVQRCLRIPNRSGRIVEVLEETSTGDRGGIRSEVVSAIQEGLDESESRSSSALSQ
mmetsp:Transcript_25021/g.54863  ORF Transcript_25021/g.54863 Transcript_25021/m.54863 type:complete len:104 (-) Transcript_25021:706-1017(-)